MTDADAVGAQDSNDEEFDPNPYYYHREVGPAPQSKTAKRNSIVLITHALCRCSPGRCRRAWAGAA